MGFWGGGWRDAKQIGKHRQRVHEKNSLGTIVVMYLIQNIGYLELCQSWLTNQHIAIKLLIQLFFVKFDIFISV